MPFMNFDELPSDQLVVQELQAYLVQISGPDGDSSSAIRDRSFSFANISQRFRPSCLGFGSMNRKTGYSRLLT